MKKQNLILLAASFIFYGFFDYRFCFLLATSILICYWGGLKIYQANLKSRKFWFIALLCINLSILFFFKYFNFFISSFVSLNESLGLRTNLESLNLILPLGISFYTFHNLSYIIDIYTKKIRPANSIIEYSIFVSFFPLLVAGPIERAQHLLPQLGLQRKFNYMQAVDGIRQMLWGFFKKIVVADNCSSYANYVFSNYETLQTGTLILGAIAFSIQIYADFSGYSDIAIGTAKLFGINLLKNFSYPYFSRDIAEFWRRWHISLTTWFRDYLYIPLGGSKHGKYKTFRNTIIIFLVSGFWHGANWTFIIWGGIDAILFLPLMLINYNRKNLDVVSKNKLLPNFKEIFQIISTFTLVSFAWIFFRSPNLQVALQYIKRIFTAPISTIPDDIFLKTTTIISILFVFGLEWIQRNKEHALQINHIKYRPIRWILYLIIVYFIFWLGGEEQEFIYFQF